MEYEVECQPEYQAGYQPEGRARRLIPSLDTRNDTRQSAPFEVGLIFIISLHKFLVGKYVKIHKIDHVTRFLCFDWLECRITLQCDTALVITLSVLVLH